MSTPDGMESRNCLVCSVPITLTQLGIDVCRACGTFFKRSIINGRTYTCRQGSRTCAFRKHEKFMCRSCRFDRCIELGMIYVQPRKRKPRKKKTEGMEEMSASSEEMQPSTSSSASAPVEESILDRMEEAYNLSRERRLEQERALVAQHKLQRIAHPTLELYISNITSLYAILRVTIKEAVSLLRYVFDYFDHIPILHRTTLFKNFIGKFCMLECVYLSSKYFKNGFKSLQAYAQDYHSLLFPIHKMEVLTVREFHALIALAYCDVDQCLDLTDEVLRSAERVKARIFEELQDYYRNELRLVRFSERLGNLMTIAHVAGEAGRIMYEELRMYSAMFGVYSEDQLFGEIFFE